MVFALARGVEMACVHCVGAFASAAHAIDGSEELAGERVLSEPEHARWEQRARMRCRQQRKTARARRGCLRAKRPPELPRVHHVACIENQLLAAATTTTTTTTTTTAATTATTTTATTTTTTTTTTMGWQSECHGAREHEQDTMTTAAERTAHDHCLFRTRPHTSVLCEGLQLRWRRVRQGREAREQLVDGGADADARIN
jgi:hypothetical protein